MEKALIEARKAFAIDEVPVGAILTYNGDIIAAAHNLTHKACDPTGHAEIRAIRMACETLNRERLTDCDLYVTLEPCAMCAAAISFARIRRLYFAAEDVKGGAVTNGPRFYTQSTCHHAPEVYTGLCEEEAAALLKEFFVTKRGPNQTNK